MKLLLSSIVRNIIQEEVSNLRKEIRVINSAQQEVASFVRSELRSVLASQFPPQGNISFMIVIVINISIVEKYSTMQQALMYAAIFALGSNF